MAGAVHEPLISFACGPDGSPTSIEDVPSGLACQCTCFACKEPLVARKGAIRRWSFAHQSTGMSECEWAAETALHYAMKEIIAQEQMIFVPDLVISGELIASYGESVKRTARTPGKLVRLDSVDVEFSVHPIRPDVVAYAGTHRLFIEVFVTHGVDERKLQRIRELNASAIQIDLRRHERTVDRQSLRKLLLEACGEKTWLFHAKKNRFEADLLSSLREEVATKEAAHAEEIASRLIARRREKEFRRQPDRLLHQALGEEPALPFADGAVMCFRLLSGGDAYLKRSPQGALILEYSRVEDVNVIKLVELGLEHTLEPTLWNIPDSELIFVIPFLNRMSASTTNRTSSEYKRHRYHI